MNNAIAILPLVSDRTTKLFIYKNSKTFISLPLHLPEKVCISLACLILNSKILTSELVSD